MAYRVVKVKVQPNLNMFILALRVDKMVTFLGHDPQAKAFLQGAVEKEIAHLYQDKQRKTERKRIEALKEYISPDRMIGGSSSPLLPPLSVVYNVSQSRTIGLLLPRAGLSLRIATRSLRAC